MKICFDNVNFSSSSGPNSFGTKLASQFYETGHEIVNFTSDYDVYLSFISQSKPPFCSRSQRVLRLDGIWSKKENFEANNRQIYDSYISYDKIIIQSKFDKKVIFNLFGERENVFVIPNGIKFEEVRPIEKKSDLLFVCSANWHEQKRLVDNILLFQHIKRNLNKNSELYILGSNAEPFLNKLSKSDLEGVRYLGSLPEIQCMRIYATADYMIHLAFLEHCPNVVVHALAQGCPVICTDLGGTKELVKKNGIIIKEKREYDYGMINYDLPYELNFSNFVLPDKKISVKDISHIDIRNVSKKYIEVFEGRG